MCTDGTQKLESKHKTKPKHTSLDKREGCYLEINYKTMRLELTLERHGSELSGPLQARGFPQAQKSSINIFSLIISPPLYLLYSKNTAYNTYTAQNPVICCYCYYQQGFWPTAAPVVSGGESEVPAGPQGHWGRHSPALSRSRVKGTTVLTA